MHDDVRAVFEGALTGRPCRWPLDADALHEFILNDDAAEAMLKLLGTPAAHGRAVHVPGPGPIVSRDFIRLVYRAAGSGEPTVRVFGRGLYRLVGLFSPMARAAYEMAYLMQRAIGRSQEAGLARRPTRTVCRGPWRGSAATGQQLNTAASS